MAPNKRAVMNMHEGKGGALCSATETRRLKPAEALRSSTKPSGPFGGTI